MVGLLRDVMGLRVEFEEPTTTELSLPSGDRVQVFAPGDPYGNGCTSGLPTATSTSSPVDGRARG